MKNKFALKLISKLLQNKDIATDDLINIICNILKPLSSKKKLSSTSENIINRCLQQCNICVKCKSNSLRSKSDLFCKNCKSVLKEVAKNKIK